VNKCRMVTELSDLSADARFRVALFRSLHDTNVNYCVLRKYDQLPYRSSEHDIDILIQGGQLCTCDTIVRQCAIQHNAKLIYLEDKPDQLVLCVVGRSGIDFWKCTIDFQCLLAWKGIEYISGREVLDRAEEIDGVRRAIKEDSLLIALLNDALLSGRIKDEYRLKILESGQRLYSFLLERLCDLLTPGARNDLRQLLSGEKRFLPRLRLWKLRSSLLRRAFAKKPFKTLHAVISAFKHFLSRRIRPPGLFVAVLGVDGSGKTTIIREVSQKLEQILRRKIVVKQFRPGLLPRPGALLGSKPSILAVRNPHFRPPCGLVGSVLLLTYHTFDYVIGYWFKVIPVISSRGSVVFFDRYFHDYLVDPIRHRVKLPLLVIRCFNQLIPRPDLIVLLKAPSKSIHDRKGELALDVIDSQQDKLGVLAKADSHTVVLDSSKDIARLSIEVTNTIIEQLAKRRR